LHIRRQGRCSVTGRSRKSRPMVKTALIGCGLFLGGFACPGQSPETGESLAVGVPQYVAPTHSERFRYYLKHTFSVESLVRGAAGSGISQWSDTPSEWGQGAAGYARRYGNSYAHHTIRQSIIYGVADVLGEDNRYIRSERRGFKSRVMYGIESTFLARRADGTRRPSYSRIAGLVATAFISRLWQPHSTNGAQNAWNSMGSTAGTEVGFNVVREFLPNGFRR
jgi:hypothetical protein